MEAWRAKKRVYRPGSNKYDHLVHAVTRMYDGSDRKIYVCACFRTIGGEPMNVFADPLPLDTVVTCLECTAVAETFMG